MQFLLALVKAETIASRLIYNPRRDNTILTYMSVGQKEIYHCGHTGKLGWSITFVKACPDISLINKGSLV